MGSKSLTNRLKSTFVVIWGCGFLYSPGHSPNVAQTLPKIIKAGLTFYVLVLEKRNWYQKIQKADVYISLKRIF